VKPYFDEHGVTIYHGDALAAMRQFPPSFADLILSDPPYCSGGMTEAQKGAATMQGVKRDSASRGRLPWFAGDNMTTGGLVWLLRSILIEARRVLVPNRSALLFTDWRMVPHLAPALESSGLRYRNMLVWDKGGGGMGRGFKPSYEVVLEYANGTTVYQAKNGSNMLRAARVHASKREHATQKPLALMRELMRVTLAPGGVVVDPFMGSGSTLVAAVECGARAVGVELDERHCETAVRRVRQAARRDVEAPAS
jgi:DNA modification methylase